ncbi:MAG: thiamine pyrophosphate-dependent dehydrogenase E1 component subunit alpha [Chloroflexi bacterium]|nr:thiamine pyrophosphate-dependent dehydrogenase E1 component subunit alpha [Chloroflexota bacterium]
MDLAQDVQLEMFRAMLLSRRLDERAWVLHRQGKIAFHISGIGHEAAQVGAVFAIRRGYDWVSPYYRDLAILLAVGMTPAEFVMGMMGKRGDPTSGGRQMPSHWSLKRANVISHSAPVATQSPHATGIGLAIKLRGDDRVVLTTVGEGATSQGEWYEAVNFAAVLQVPVVFVVQNNMYAISETPDMQMAIKSVAEKACGLGVPGISVDGTDVFAVYRACQEAVDRARQGGGPSLIEARTYRMTPHSSDDDDRTYRSREEVEEHKKSDPVLVAKRQLEERAILTEKAYAEMDAQIKAEVEEAVRQAEQAPYPEAEEALHPVYAEEIRLAEASHA